VNALSISDSFRSGDLPASRFREAGDVTLDLAHRDGRVEDKWLGLQPAEFALLWRLAEEPGWPVSDGDLAIAMGYSSREAGHTWLVRCAAEVERRLKVLDVECLVEAHPNGGWVLTLPRSLPLI
jgi:DNA-binding response OmpR family regulator